MQLYRRYKQRLQGRNQRPCVEVCDIGLLSSSLYDARVMAEVYPTLIKVPEKRNVSFQTVCHWGGAGRIQARGERCPTARYILSVADDAIEVLTHLV